MVGKRSAKCSRPVASSQQWSVPSSSMRAVHGPRDDVAGQELVHEPLAVGVADQGAVSAERLGQQRPGHRGVVQRRRVELHELDVGHRHAGPQGHGDAVARGLGRVGGDGEELSGPAGGDERVRRPDLAPDAVAAEGGDAPHRPPSTRRSRANECSNTAAAVALAASTSARSISAPVAAPPACTTRAWEWPPSRAEQVAVAVAVEHRAERDELVDPCRALVDEHAHGVDVAQPGAGAERVGEVEVGGVVVAAEDGGDAALGPSGGRLLQLALGQHPDAEAVAVRRRAPRPRGRRRRCPGPAGRGRGPGSDMAPDAIGRSLASTKREPSVAQPQPVSSDNAPSVPEKIPVTTPRLEATMATPKRTLPSGTGTVKTLPPPVDLASRARPP